MLRPAAEQRLLPARIVMFQQAVRTHRYAGSKLLIKSGPFAVLHIRHASISILFVHS